LKTLKELEAEVYEGPDCGDDLHGDVCSEEVGETETENDLKSTRRENGPAAHSAFNDSDECRRHDTLCDDGTTDWNFEHGQLWITCTCGAAWSVVDAEGGPAVRGFDFEQVSQGDCEH